MLFAQLWARWAPAAWLTASVCTSAAAPSSRRGWSITAATSHPSAWPGAFLSHTGSLGPPICQRDAFPQSLPRDIQQGVLIFPSIQIEVLCSGVPGHSLTPQELGKKKSLFLLLSKSSPINALGRGVMPQNIGWGWDLPFRASQWKCYSCQRTTGVWGTDWPPSVKSKFF